MSNQQLGRSSLLILVGGGDEGLGGGAQLRARAVRRQRGAVERTQRARSTNTAKDSMQESEWTSQQDRGTLS